MVFTSMGFADTQSQEGLLCIEDASNFTLQDLVSETLTDGENLMMVYEYCSDEYAITYRDYGDEVVLISYKNGEPFEISRCIPGSGEYMYAILDGDFSVTRNRNVLEIESISYDIVSTGIDTGKENQQSRTAPTITTMGSMHYDNPYSGVRYSVRCQLYQWINEGRHVRSVASGYSLGSSLLTVASWLVAAISMPSSVAEAFVSSLLSASILEILSGAYKTTHSTVFVCDEYVQEIHGKETSPGTTRDGTLEGTKYLYKATGATVCRKFTYEGFTDNSWRTSTLGRQMMYEVFGVEYVPNSWTSV